MNRIIPLLLSISFSSPLIAAFITSEGQAPIRHNDLSTARYLATLDAMSQASLENGAEITSDTIMNNLAIRSDTVRIRTQGKISKVHMLQEWQEEDIYHVRISAESNDLPQRCNSPNALVHQKKIGVTQFTNLALQQSSDLRGAEKGLSRMASRAIQKAPKLTAVDLSDYAIEGNSPAEQREQVQHLARQMGVQFILSGRLLAASRDQMGDLAESGMMKDLSSLIGIAQEKFQNRHLEIETTLYDGESGETVLTQQDGVTLFGETYVGRNNGVGSHSFLQTKTGQGFQQLIEQQRNLLVSELSCAPMSTSIIAIDGNRITLPVGHSADLHRGDRLVVVDQNDPLKILGVLQIIEISGNRAVGITDVDAQVLGITTTDRVRSW